MNQQKYVLDLLDKFEMINAKPTDTHMATLAENKRWIRSDKCNHLSTTCLFPTVFVSYETRH